MTDRNVELTRRRLLGGLLTVGGAGAAAGAGTMAYFSDTESSTDNRVTAGTLNLAYGTDSTFSFNTSLKPTDFTSDSITLVSSGSLDGSLDVDVSYGESDASGKHNPDKTAKEVAQNLEVTKLHYDADVSGWDPDVSEQITTSNSPPTLHDLATNDKTTGESTPNDLIDLPDPGQGGTDFTIEFRLKDVKNQFQGDGVSIDFTFRLNQNESQ